MKPFGTDRGVYRIVYSPPVGVAPILAAPAGNLSIEPSPFTLRPASSCPLDWTKRNARDAHGARCVRSRRAHAAASRDARCDRCGLGWSLRDRECAGLGDLFSSARIRGKRSLLREDRPAALTPQNFRSLDNGAQLVLRNASGCHRIVGERREAAVGIHQDALLAEQPDGLFPFGDISSTVDRRRSAWDRATTPMPMRRSWEAPSALPFLRRAACRAPGKRSADGNLRNRRNQRAVIAA